MDYLEYTLIDFVEDASFKSFARRLKDEDIVFWEDWIKKHPEKESEFNLALNILTGVNARYKIDEENSKEAELQKLLSSINNENRIADIDQGQRIFQYVRIAAVFILLIGIGTAMKFLFFNNKNPETNQLTYKELKTPPGKRMHITLTDGTHIWLNAESSLKYPENFTGNERIVYLSGEAYFDVAHDRKKPFSVITSEIRVNVVGTSFNVKSYSDENTIETTLETGIIRIEELYKESTTKDNDIILKPHQKFVFYKGNKTDKIEKNEAVAKNEAKELFKIEGKKSAIVEIKETEIFTGWKDNKLVFKNERLFELKRRLERWYNIKIGISDPELNNKRLSGVFVNETVEEALKALRFASDINYFHRNDSIIIFTEK